MERAGESVPVRPADGVQPEVAHHARKENADRRRRDGVGVREPEVERHRARLGQESDGNERESNDDEAVRPAAREHLADLREIERTRAAVKQRDPDQQQEGADRVHDREVDRSLERLRLLDPVTRERERRNAHQLEEDEHVEEVAREREAGHRADEDQRQHVKVLRHGLAEVVPAHDERRGRKHTDERGDSGGERIDAERDPDRNAAAGLPASEPVVNRVVRGAEHEQHREDGYGERDADRNEIVDLGRSEVSERAQRRGRQQWHRHDERDEDGGHVCRRKASGSTVPARFQISITSASKRATPVTLTTTSVSVRACTTGSTAPTLTGTPEVKIGAFFPLR